MISWIESLLKNNYIKVEHGDPLNYLDNSIYSFTNKISELTMIGKQKKIKKNKKKKKK